MQSKINSFFKPCSSTSSFSASQKKSVDLPDLFAHNLPASADDDVEKEEDDFSQEPEVPILYTRRAPNTNGDDNVSALERDDKTKLDFGQQSVVADCNRVSNKKRKYAQFHLDLGQSDFMFRDCKTCGFKFAPGDEEDGKLHKEFHKNYTHGIRLKGWRNERLVDMDSLENGRVILVLNDAPPAHSNKVQEVIKMMEMELGDGWIFHKHCKVYLFISSQRAAGCLVAEPIKKSYRLVTNSNAKSDVTTIPRRNGKLTSTTLQFGGISFHREVLRKMPSSGSKNKFDDALLGAIICEKEAVPALCGIRPIWVTTSIRRKHVASYLLERKSFCSGLVLEQSQLAFSQPTNAGKLLASSYTKNESFLVYTTNSL